MLIETLPAAFEMDEILYELRQVGVQNGLGFRAQKTPVPEHMRVPLSGMWHLGSCVSLMGCSTFLVSTLLSHTGYAFALQHSAGLNCGRWDYIFSFIKTMRADPSYIMPDRCALRNPAHWARLGGSCIVPEERGCSGSQGNATCCCAKLRTRIAHLMPRLQPCSPAGNHLQWFWVA